MIENLILTVLENTLRQANANLAAQLTRDQQMTDVLAGQATIVGLLKALGAKMSQAETDLETALDTIKTDVEQLLASKAAEIQAAIDAAVAAKTAQDDAAFNAATAKATSIIAELAGSASAVVVPPDAGATGA